MLERQDRFTVMSDTSDPGELKLSDCGDSRWCKQVICVQQMIC